MVLNFFKGQKVKVEMDDGTQKVVKMVEGSGIYTCDTHKFITDDLNEFKMHEKTETHVQDANTSGKCVICKNHVDMSGKLSGMNAVCDECEQRLIKSQETARARIQAMKASKGNK